MSLFNRSVLLGKVALAITAGVVLHAQEVTGNLTGTVKDDKGAPVAGVTVKIQAPQLIMPRMATTDAQGVFRAMLLPPGDYTITVTKKDYISQQAKNTRIGVGTNIRQDFVMKPIQQQSMTVEVVAAAATMDKSEAKSATSLSSEFLLEIPTASGDRAFTGAMDFAPGVVKNSGGGSSIRGGLTQETGYTLNGTSIKDDYEGRQNTTRLIDDAVEDTQVIQSPLHARFGRTGGGTVNVVTKVGGNDFSASIRTYLSRDSWQAKRHNQPEEVGSYGDRGDFQTIRQYDIFVSGPIIKDRLWFAVSTIQIPNAGSTNKVMDGESPVDWYAGSRTGYQWGELTGRLPVGQLYTYDLGKSIVTMHNQDFLDAKLTLAITGDQTVDFTFQQNDQTYSNENPYGLPIISTLGSHSYPYVENDKYYSYGYRGVFGSDMFLEARYSKSTAHVLFPAPMLEHVRLSYGGTQNGMFFPYGFNIATSPDKRDNQSGNINFKKFFDIAGNHEVDLGYDFYEFLRGTQTANGMNNQRFYAAAAASVDTDGNPIFNPATMSVDPYGFPVAFQAVSYSDLQYYPGEWGSASTTLSDVPVYRKYFGKDGTTKNRTTSIYINDTWKVNNNLNVMVGFRSDKFRVVDTDGSVLVNRNGPISPRFMLRWDPDGTGKHLMTFTAAKYIQEIGAGFSDAFIKKANGAYAQYAWTAPTAWVDYKTLTNTANYGNNLANPLYFYNATANNVLKNLSNPYVYELTLAYRRQYTNGSYVNLTLVHKEWKNMFTLENDLTNGHVVDVPDPTGKGLASKKALAIWFSNSDKLTRKYNALEMDFRHIINSTWTVGGNYTLSRLVGNGQGGDNGSQGFFDTALSAPTAYAYAISQMKDANGKSLYGVNNYAPEGLLLSNQTHKARIYLTATLPLGKGHINYSALIRYDSGAAFSATAPAKMGVPSDQTNTSLASLNPGTFTYYANGRGTFGFNDLYSVDAKIDWALPIVGSLQIVGNVQVNNVFNTMQQYGYSATFASTILSAPGNINVSNAKNFGKDTAGYANWNYGRSVTASIGLKF